MSVRYDYLEGQIAGPHRAPGTAGSEDAAMIPRHDRPPGTGSLSRKLSQKEAEPRHTRGGKEKHGPVPAGLCAQREKGTPSLKPASGPQTVLICSLPFLPS